MDLSSGGISWQFLWNLNLNGLKRLKFPAKSSLQPEGGLSNTQSISFFLWHRGLLRLSNCVFTALWVEHTWQNGYCHSCSSTVRGGLGLKYLLHPESLLQGSWSRGQAGQGFFIKSVRAGCPVALSLPVKAFSASWVGQEESWQAPTCEGPQHPHARSGRARRAPSCLGCGYPAFGEKESKC